MQNKQIIVLPKPQKPQPDECCGGGSCSPCVWDEYRQNIVIGKRKTHHRPYQKKQVDNIYPLTSRIKSSKKR
ncbi:oxidoreductase-like domain-containing protein [Pseudoalteromonas sp. Angola-31]|nr:oxidoreductase-like domain-containing protein [Pseudoalteromonas sp. Angola-31]